MHSCLMNNVQRWATLHPTPCILILHPTPRQRPPAAQAPEQGACKQLCHAASATQPSEAALFIVAILDISNSGHGLGHPQVTLRSRPGSHSGHTQVTAWVTLRSHSGHGLGHTQVTAWVTLRSRPGSHSGHTQVTAWVTLRSHSGHGLGHTQVTARVTLRSRPGPGSRPAGSPNFYRKFREVAKDPGNIWYFLGPPINLYNIRNN